MADFSKVVDKLTETNKSLAALEAQGIADNGIKSIIAQSLPEVLNERNLAKKREIFDKDTKITEVDDRVEDNTKAIITLTDEQKETNNILNNQENTAKTFGETFQDLGFKEAITQLGKNVLRSIVSPGKKEEEEKKKDKKDSKILVGLKSVGGALKNFGKNTLDKLVTKPAKGLFGVIKGLAAALGLVFLSRFFLSDAFPKFVTYLTDKLPRDFTGLTTSLDDITSGIVELAKGIPELTKSIKEFKLFGDGEDGESFLSKFKFAIGAGAAALSGALLSGASKVSSKISKFVSGMTVKDPTNLSKKDKIAIKVANSANKVAKPLAIVGSFLKGLPFISSLISGGFGVTEALNPETRFKGIGRIAGLGVGASAAAKVGKLDPIQDLADGIKSLMDAVGNFFSDIFNFDYKSFLKGIPGVGTFLRFFGKGDDSKDQPLEGRAEGGPVGTGQPYVVGERGQELFVPNQPGQIVNAQRTAEMMKGGSGGNGGGSTSIVVAPNNVTSSTNTSNNTSTVSYIGNPDPIFQRSSSYAI